MSQLPNFYLLLQLQLQEYLVDVLFSDETIRNDAHVPFIIPMFYFDRLTAALLTGMLYILPMGLCHYWEYRKVKLDIGALVREFLQGSLIRRYLNFTDESRRAVKPAVLQVAMLSDTTQLTEGYDHTLKLIEALGKAGLLGLFIVKENERALPACFLMPFFMLIFAHTRTRLLSGAMQTAMEKKSLLAEVTQETCEKYTLIAEYGQRPVAAERFAAIGEELSEAGLDLEIVTTNNKQFPEWLGPCFTGAYVAFAANSVYQGDLRVGVFLATTRVFKELAEAFGHMYEVIISISSAFGPLRTITYFLNLETDGKNWKGVNRKRREATKAAREEIVGIAANSNSKEQHSMFASDLILLRCRDVSFTYDTSLGASEYLFVNIDCQVPQGKVVAVVGKPGNGKSTFLKLIGHQCFPVQGEVFIPTYLRILHVSHDPVLLKMSAWDNLIFGYPAAEPELVRSILTMLEMWKTLEIVNRDLEAIQAGGGEEASEKVDLDGWHIKFNAVEKAKIHLARALIVNPEILVLQRPFGHYGQHMTELVMASLKEHVDNKGVCLPSAPFLKNRRRPRTLFFSPSSEVETKVADVIWEITPDKHLHWDNFADVQDKAVF